MRRTKAWSSVSGAGATFAAASLASMIRVDGVVGQARRLPHVVAGPVVPALPVLGVVGAGRARGGAG